MHKCRQVHLHAAAFTTAATSCSTNPSTVLLQELVVDLLPSPQRCLDLIHELLPQLAFEVYRAFIQQVFHKLAAPSSDTTLHVLCTSEYWSVSTTPVCMPICPWCCCLGMADTFQPLHTCVGRHGLHAIVWCDYSQAWKCYARYACAGA